MPYQPNWDSLREHPVPQWFNDAKLGIFIHWGLYSLPGWAPTTGPLPEVVASEGWQGWFRRNPYAEWYMNSLRVPGSPTAAYHTKQYGADFTYEQFAPQFNQAVEQWDADAWADLFQQAGAKYVVLTTKHHDGFLLWPSCQPNPFRSGYHATRDLVGDLTAAVRQRNMTMGLYYSGGLDWTFNDQVIADLPDLFKAVPQSPVYATYATAHFRELIDRYTPSVLWNDIGYPVAADLPALFADYYNQHSDGVINDRFTQIDLRTMPENPAELFANGMPQPKHFDFRTPEYAVFDEIKTEKWESCRGLGFSFGYNRNETAATMLSATELIHSFVDIVSKNGNLLLNIGPRGDGSIPAEQRERLLALGGWLAVHGEAIYGTCPWQRAEGQTANGTAVRFTQGSDAFYATILGAANVPAVTLLDVAVPEGTHISQLGNQQPLEWQQDAANTVITLPQQHSDAPAYTLRIQSS